MFNLVKYLGTKLKGNGNGHVSMPSFESDFETSMEKVKFEIRVKKLNPDAKLPTQNIDDIGFDLYSLTGGIIKPFATKRIKTGIAQAEKPPVNSFFKIESRSGLASKGLFVLGGIVDLSYTGDISVLLHNGSDTEFKFKKGDRVGQLVIYSCLSNTAHIEVKFVEVDEQMETERSDQGFGSSGD